MNGNTAPADSSGDQGAGGGIANLSFSLIGGSPDDGTLTITLSQIRNNTASGIGGGILENGVDPDFTPGAPGGPLTLKLSTVTGNTAAEGGGIFASSGSPIAFKLTLVAKTSPDNCFRWEASRAVRTEKSASGPGSAALLSIPGRKSLARALQLSGVMADLPGTRCGGW